MRSLLARRTATPGGGFNVLGCTSVKEGSFCAHLRAHVERARAALARDNGDAARVFSLKLKATPREQRRTPQGLARTRYAVIALRQAHPRASRERALKLPLRAPQEICAPSPAENLANANPNPNPDPNPDPNSNLPRPTHAPQPWTASMPSAKRSASSGGA